MLKYRARRNKIAVPLRPFRARLASVWQQQHETRQRRPNFAKKSSGLPRHLWQFCLELQIPFFFFFFFNWPHLAQLQQNSLSQMLRKVLLLASQALASSLLHMIFTVKECTALTRSANISEAPYFIDLTFNIHFTWLPMPFQNKTNLAKFSTQTKEICLLSLTQNFSGSFLKPLKGPEHSWE